MSAPTFPESPESARQRWRARQDRIRSRRALESLRADFAYNARTTDRITGKGA